MQWHIRLKHHSFNKLTLMAVRGMIPKKLANFAKHKAQICLNCAYGKATNKPRQKNP